MKYLALWALTLATVLLGVGLLYLGYVIVTTLLLQPGSWWIPLVIFAAFCIATIVAAYDYLTEKRPPKAGQ